MKALDTPEALKPPGWQTPELKTLAATGASQPDLGLGSDFAVGDFVWGKIKSHPWWPGQVYDPSQASDHAKKTPRKDQRLVLVAYFGDDSFAWCSPSQLKPFAEDFQLMAESSSSKSFKTALASALGELSKCLEAQMSCNCCPEEYAGMNAKLGGCSAEEFLCLLKDSAADSSTVNGLEVAVLRSWILAFEKRVSTGHKRKAVADLVDKIDLDVPAMEVGEGREDEGEGEEAWVSGNVAVKGVDILAENGQKGRKRRSMAALIAEMDLDSDEGNESEEEKKGRRKSLEVKNENVGNGNIVKEEEGYSRRERKRSKYLSPPYCFLSGGGLAKSLVSPKEETRIPKSSSLTSPRSLSAVRRCSFGEMQEDAMDVFSFQADELDVKEVLSEFIQTAANPFHMKWHRLAKTVRGFFAEFRSSVYSSGEGFEAYQKKLMESVVVGNKTSNKGMNVQSEEGKGTEVKRGRKRKDKVNDEGESLVVKSEESKKAEVRRGRKRKDQVNGVAETPVVLSHRLTVHSDKVEKRTPDMNMAEDAPDGKTSLTPKPQAVVAASAEFSSGRKRGRRKTDATQNIMVNLSCDTENNMETPRTRQKVAKEKEVSGPKPPAVGVDVRSPMKEANSVEKEESGKGKSIINVPISVGSKIANGSGERKSRQKKNNKTAASCEDPAALLLTFSPGITLPSKEELISACSDFGPIIQSEIELLTESGTARVVFKRTSDAEKAYNEKVGSLGQLVATTRLHYLSGNLDSSPALTPMQVPKPPLPYIRKSLERMISTLGGSTVEKVAGASVGLKPDPMDNLVGEMQGLLTKVNDMLSGPAPGTSS